MPAFLLRRTLLVTSLLSILLPLATAQKNTAKPAPATLPSESPTVFTPTNTGFDYDRREVMIPMRDGVKLHTVILVPKGAKNSPILLTRTPYSATQLTTNSQSSHLGSSLFGYDNATDVIIDGGYIRVIQDVRGKYGSEGDYVMNRPLRGPLNPTNVDHATDTYDTIDWLVKNTPESNGKVGIIGISYDGFTTLMGLFHPHPALKVAVPMNPMVDGWRGDDWFHNGAFREQNMEYIYEQDGTRDNSVKWWTSNFDDYDMFMDAGSAGELGKRRGLEQTGFWQKVIAHPSYDAFWQEQAVDKLLAAEPLTVPTLLVHSLWDAEDIYGAMAVYKAIKPKDTSNDKVYLVMGPWHHGQGIEDGSTLGAIKFNSDTSLYFRENILAPFLAKYLKDDTSAPAIAPVSAYESGTNTWRKLPSWPTACESGCASTSAPLYLRAEGKLSFTAPQQQDAALRRLHLRPRKTRSLPSPSDPTRRLRQRPHLAELARRRPARSLRPHRRRGLHLRRPHRPGQDQRPTRRQPHRLHQRNRLRLGGQAHRRLPRRSPRPTKDGGLPVHGLRRHLPRPLPREPRKSKANPLRPAAPLPLQSATRKPRFSTRPPHHGPGAIQLVPALRSQSPDLCPEHLLGETTGLSQSRAADLPSPRDRPASSNCQSLQNLER